MPRHTLRRATSAARFAINDLGAWRFNKGGPDGIVAALPTVHGSWPMPGSGAQLFAACDPIYFHRHAKGMLASVNQNSPDTSVHIHLYNPTDDILNEIATISKNMQRASLTWTWETSDVHNMDWHEKSIYLASMRFPRLYMALQASRRPILSIDIDCFVRKDLGSYLEAAAECDLGLVLRPEYRDPGKRVLAVAVYVAPTPTGLTVFGAAASRMAAHLAYKRATEKLDQRCLWAAYNSNRKRIRFWGIPRSLSDFDFHESSAIWTGKGHRKATDRYQAELGAILSRFAAGTKENSEMSLDEGDADLQPGKSSEAGN